eukprot:TRINITY_DN21357_c0_g2_i1.p1 TRINITY_DN21357_c0_g2~~TRINITY_DN21357_c0_g2_i1.p1  ORF type:complete len:260 (+),score=69.18 TRINITY_DN21357_c0_g2_i1:28-780(+)
MVAVGNRFAAFLSDDDEDNEEPRSKLSEEVDSARRGEKKRVLKRKRASADTAATVVEAEADDEAAERAEGRRPKRRKATTLSDAADEANAAPAAEAASTGDASSGSQRKAAAGGVEYKVLRTAPAGAAVARKGAVVRLLYEGRLPAKKGRRFDAGEIDFVIGDGSMVRGFEAGVLGMAVGEKRTLFIPAKMGYGKKGKKPKVPPNSDLEFDVILTHAGLDSDWTFAQDNTSMSKARREAAKRRGKKPKQS